MRRIGWIAIAITLLTALHVRAFDVATARQLVLASNLRSEDFGVLISTDEKEVFQLNAEDKFKPASVSKVITGAAALELMGTNFKFRTQLLYDGAIDEETIDGSIYLRNGGDPSFHSGRLYTLLSGLKERKIKTIEGDLILDDFRFQDVTDPQWRKKIDAINSGLFPLFVRLDPPEKGFSRQKKDTFRQVLDLEGQFVVYQNMIEPDMRTAQQFAGLLKKNGIRLKGKVRRGAVSERARIISEVVSPLPKIVESMLKKSNNFYADLLVRNLAFVFGERPATFKSGLELLTYYLDHVDIPRSEYKLNSGSGFSHQNQITPKAMVQLLQYLKNQKSIADHLASSLPIAGVSGTLVRRMTTTSAKGRVWAKTGFLRQVPRRQLDGSVSLAGFALPPGEKPLTFAFFYNGNAGPETVKTLFDQLCIAMIGQLPGQPKIVAKTGRPITKKSKKKAIASAKGRKKSSESAQK